MRKRSDTFRRFLVSINEQNFTNCCVSYTIKTKYHCKLLNCDRSLCEISWDNWMALTRRQSAKLREKHGMGWRWFYEIRQTRYRFSRSDKPTVNANFDGTLTHVCPAVWSWYESILILLIMSYPITIVISMCRETAVISAERTHLAP